jgi:hypothetical protein
VVKVTLPVKLPDRVVNVPAFAVNDPLESRATIVEAPLEDAAVVRALSIVPDETFEALIPLIAAPLPVKEAAFIAPASNSPLAPRRTIVAPTLLELAVVLALSIVPEVMFEALIAVKATPLPETAVNEPDAPVITFPAKEPSASRRTIVEAPLAEVAVVLALSKVPEEMLEALIPVKAIPLPDTESAVIAPALKDPPASRKTIVAAPLLELAVVNAFEIIPLVTFEALTLLILEPSPLKENADTTLAPNEPFASRVTMVEALLEESAVVNAFDIVPELMLEALISVSEEPLPEIVAFIVPITVTLLAKVTF